MLKSRSVVSAGVFAGAGRPFKGTSSILAVALYGREVIEGAKGFRGSAQQVQEAYLDGECRHCGGQAETTRPGEVWQTFDSVEYWTLQTYCLGCAETLGGVTFRPAELTGMFGVDITISAMTRRLWKPGQWPQDRARRPEVPDTGSYKGSVTK